MNSKDFTSDEISVITGALLKYRFSHQCTQKEALLCDSIMKKISDADIHALDAIIEREGLKRDPKSISAQVKEALR